MGGLVEAELVHFVRRLSVVAAGEFEVVMSIYFVDNSS